MLLSCFVAVLNSLNLVPVLGNIHVFTFQQDEADLLHDWVEYHVKLVDKPENVHVIDWNSSSPAVLDELYRLRANGVDVFNFPTNTAILHHGDGERFDEVKSRLLTERMLKYKPGASFLVPLDIDEFLVAADLKGKNFTANREVVVDAFSDLSRDGFMYQLQTFDAHHCSHSSSSRRVTYATSFTRNLAPYYFPPAGCYDKKFFLARTFLRTGLGNHNGSVTLDSQCTEFSHAYKKQCGYCFHPSRLALVHFGMESGMPPETFERKIMRGVRSLGFLNRGIRGRCSGPGAQYCILHDEYFGGGVGKSRKDKRPFICLHAMGSMEIVNALG